MEKRIILAMAEDELTDEQMALFLKDINRIEASNKALEQKDWKRIDQINDEGKREPDATKRLRDENFKRLSGAWEKESNRELNMRIREKEKLDRANQLINEKAEVQGNGSLRISSEDWRGINRKLNEGKPSFQNIFNKLSEVNEEIKAETAAMPKQGTNPPLERRNINSKENIMSEENTYRPRTNHPTKEDQAVFLKALQERKVLMDALENGTLSCLPGTDGYADTTPAFNLMSPDGYKGDTLLYIKEHQKQNGYPTAEYITEHQIGKAKQDYPEIALKEEQQPVRFYFNEFNAETQKYAPKEIQLFNIAQTTNPQLLKDWVIEQEEKKIERMKTQFSESYKPPAPKQSVPAPDITCTSTEPKEYLGQYLAAVSLGGKFKVSKEQAAEFTQKLESLVYERGDNGHTNPFALSKLASKANEECGNVIRDIKMDYIKSKREQTPQQQQEQTQSRGRGM